MKLAFRLSLLMLPFLIGCEIEDVAGWVDDARCKMRVGVLADTQLSPPHSNAMFEKALRYFDGRATDAVIIAGEVTESGALAQWREAKRIWEKVFPGGRRSDGKSVSLIVVTGETDNSKVFEELTGRKFAPVFSQQICGYTFIGANWKNAAGADSWALKPLLAEIKGERPFFYIQNLVPFATCCPNEGRITDYDGGKVTYMLSKFPNAVAICGRSHTPLTDEAAFWRGEFTCVNAGSFSYAKMRGEDCAVNQLAHHGLVMSVYDSSVVFERIDFGSAKPNRTRAAGVYVEKLGKDWRVDLPAAPVRSVAHQAPQFWDDTRLMVFPSEKTVSVRFPPVLAKHTGVRAYAYEVKVEGPGREPILKTVYSPACCASEDRETKPVTCDFPRTELPKGEVRISVTPLNAFGDCGRSISESVNML